MVAGTFHKKLRHAIYTPVHAAPQILTFAFVYMACNFLGAMHLFVTLGTVDGESKSYLRSLTVVSEAMLGEITTLWPTLWDQRRIFSAWEQASMLLFYYFFFSLSLLLLVQFAMAIVMDAYYDLKFQRVRLGNVLKGDMSSALVMWMRYFATVYVMGGWTNRKVAALCREAARLEADAWRREQGKCSEWRRQSVKRAMTKIGAYVSAWGAVDFSKSARRKSIVGATTTAEARGPPRRLSIFQKRRQQQVMPEAVKNNKGSISLGEVQLDRMKVLCVDTGTYSIIPDHLREFYRTSKSFDDNFLDSVIASFGMAQRAYEHAPGNVKVKFVGRRWDQASRRERLAIVLRFAMQDIEVGCGRMAQLKDDTGKALTLARLFIMQSKAVTTIARHWRGFKARSLDEKYDLVIAEKTRMSDSSLLNLFGLAQVMVDVEEEEEAKKREQEMQREKENARKNALGWGLLNLKRMKILGSKKYEKTTSTTTTTTTSDDALAIVPVDERNDSARAGDDGGGRTETWVKRYRRLGGNLVEYYTMQSSSSASGGMQEGGNDTILMLPAPPSSSGSSSSRRSSSSGRGGGGSGGESSSRGGDDSAKNMKKNSNNKGKEMISKE